MYNGNTYFNRFNSPIAFKHLFDIFSVCCLQFRLVSNVNHKQLNKSTLSLYTSSVLFNIDLLIFSHSLILESSSFIIVSVLLLSSVVSLR